MKLEVISLLTLGALSESRELTYRLTFRDFLPAECMPESNYTEAFALTSISNWGGLTDEHYANLDSLESLNISPQGIPNALASRFCPYWTDMKAFRVSGHPDFQARGSEFTNGPSCTIGCEGTSSTRRITPTVQEYLEFTDESGLPKVVSCTNDPEQQCGRQCSNFNDAGECTDASLSEKFTMTKSKFFRSWYHDDPKYNKRIGKTLVLDESSSGTFVFDALADYPDLCRIESNKVLPECPLPAWDPLGDFTKWINSSTYETLFPDFRTAPAWISSLEDSTAKWGKGKFWYTTEVHSYFEFSGNETFSFRGDDDVWVFINGRLAVDLGGLHSQLDGKIDLGEYADYFNLTVGGIYSFDMFHAERHTDHSNYRIETTLSTSCNVALEGAGEIAFNSVNATEDEYSFFGTSSFLPESSSLILTSNTSFADSPGSVFLQQQQNVGSGFVATFSFKIYEDGKHQGFAFIIHNRDDGLKNLPTSVGGGLNFRNLEYSLAVVVDVCQDREQNKCEEQGVRVHFPKNMTEDPRNSPEMDTLAARDVIMRPLDFNNEEHQVRVEYLQSPPWLQVYIDDSLYLRVDNLDLQTMMGGRDAFVGFTSSTSSDPGTIEIFDLEITTVAIDPAMTTSVNIDPDAQPSTIWGDGSDFVDYTFQTMDNCGKTIEYGGFANSANAIFVETLQALVEGSNETASRTEGEAVTVYSNNSLVPQIVPGVIVDNQDGSYSARLQTTSTGLFSAYVCYGAQSCSFNVTLEDIQLEGFPSGLQVAQVSPGPDAAYFAFVKQAAIVIPPTSAPTTAPSAFVQPTFEDDKTLLYAAVGGGAGFLVFLLVAFILIRYRKKWQKDKNYIEQGKLYRLDGDVEFDGNDEYGTVGRDLVHTRAEVMRERARTYKSPNGKQVGELLTENEELKESIRLNKMKLQVKASTNSRSGMMGQKPLPTTRREFSPTEDF